MTTNPVSAATTGAAATTPIKTTHATELDSNQFMMLLLSQLRNQNPLDPVNDKEFMAQMAQMNSLQEFKKMNLSLTQLTTSNHVSEAASMIGRTVEADLPDGSIVKGLVTGVTLLDGEVLLMVGDKQLPVSSVFSISAPEPTTHA